MLGMYVHTHWSYQHPYAARTWTLRDWQQYLTGLKSLGYDIVMIWPLLDLMPLELTDSDRTFLSKIGQVIDWAHGTLQMKVAIIVGANIIGNEKAREFTFEDRPYFICEQRTDLNDSAQRARLLAARRQCFAYLKNMDYLVMIDSDPGGMPGSTNEDFVLLMRDQLRLARELNPAIEMVYWMWVGWENYNRFWDDCAKWREGDPEIEITWTGPTFIETLGLMQRHIAEPWSLLACNEYHLKAIKETGHEARVLYFPYGAVEGEPTFPLTNYLPQIIEESLAPHRQQTFPGGVMCNAQTHCLQLPGTYFFAHFASGGTQANVDLIGFGDSLLTGAGELLATSWSQLETGKPTELRALAMAIEKRATQPVQPGARAGLLFGAPERFLSDLADNLKVRAALLEFQAGMADGDNVKSAMQRFLQDFEPYQRKLGFLDSYGGGATYAQLNESLKKLGDACIDRVLREFIDWRDPLVHNGTLVRLIEAMKAYIAR